MPCDASESPARPPSGLRGEQAFGRKLVTHRIAADAAAAVLRIAAADAAAERW
jgi:hypothetical protein